MAGSNNVVNDWLTPVSPSARDFAATTQGARVGTSCNNLQFPAVAAVGQAGGKQGKAQGVAGGAVGEEGEDLYVKIGFCDEGAKDEVYT